MLNRLCDRIDNNKLAVVIIGMGVVCAFGLMFLWGMNNTHQF